MIVFTERNAPLKLVLANKRKRCMIARHKIGSAIF